MQLTKHQSRANLRINGKKQHPVGNERNFIRRGINLVKKLPPKKFNKKAFVDYDVIICIPSHNRYDKVKPKSKTNLWG